VLFTGVLVESSGCHFFATLPDGINGNEVALGAHVEGLVHRLVELSAPLENCRKYKKFKKTPTDLRTLSALKVMLAALVQKWVSAATSCAEMSALVAEAEAARRAAENFILKKQVSFLFDRSLSMKNKLANRYFYIDNIRQQRVTYNLEGAQGSVRFIDHLRSTSSSFSMVKRNLFPC